MRKMIYVVSYDDYEYCYVKAAFEDEDEAKKYAQTDEPCRVEEVELQ